MLGGAIRDPLSGRTYVYQAMRITGAGDITADIKDALPNKLPQSRISKGAAAGYSSYGNQIGLATTYVKKFIMMDMSQTYGSWCCCSAAQKQMLYVKHHVQEISLF